MSDLVTLAMARKIPVLAVPLSYLVQFEDILASTLPVRILRELGIPSALSTTLLTLLGSYNAIHLYATQKKLALTLAVVAYPAIKALSLTPVLAGDKVSKHQANGVLSYWSVYGLVRCLESTMVAPLVLSASPDAPSYIHDLFQGIRTRLLDAIEPAFTKQITTRLPSLNVSAFIPFKSAISANTRPPIFDPVPLVPGHRLSLAKRTFGSNYALLRTLVLLLCMADNFKLARRLTAWFFRPLVALSTQILFLGSTPRRRFRIVFEDEDDTEMVRNKHGAEISRDGDNSLQSTPRGKGTSSPALSSSLASSVLSSSHSHSGRAAAAAVIARSESEDEGSLSRSVSFEKIKNSFLADSLQFGTEWHSPVP